MAVLIEAADLAGLARQHRPGIRHRAAARRDLDDPSGNPVAGERVAHREAVEAGTAPDGGHLDFPGESRERRERRGDARDRVQEFEVAARAGRTVDRDQELAARFVVVDADRPPARARQSAMSSMAAVFNRRSMREHPLDRIDSNPLRNRRSSGISGLVSLDRATNGAKSECF